MVNRKTLITALSFLLLFFGTIPNSRAELTQFYGSNFGYNEDYIKNRMIIDQQNTTQLIQTIVVRVNDLKKINVNTNAIESTIANSRKELDKNNYNEAFQIALKAREMAISIGLSYSINMINSEINNATSIGADTKASAAKLEEAKKALSEEDYQNAELLAMDAYKLTINSSVGYISIKDLISSKETNAPASKYNGHTVETSGFIREIKSSSSVYNFVLDDGNGAMPITYLGGLGDIKEGDKVTVKGIYSHTWNPPHIEAETVNKGNSLVDSTSSNAKLSGFEVIIAGIGIIFALVFRRR